MTQLLRQVHAGQVETGQVGQLGSEQHLSVADGTVDDGQGCCQQRLLRLDVDDLCGRMQICLFHCLLFALN